MNDVIPQQLSPAEAAAAKTLAAVQECIANATSFRLEAGAGAGKTYSLVKALQLVITTRGAELLRNQQKVACISFTNVASDQITARIGSHPVVFSSTIHAFCWSLAKDFQVELRKLLQDLPNWVERLNEIGGIGNRQVTYDLGRPRAKADEDFVSLGHDDILPLAVKLIERPKFRSLLVAKFPILFIDEYQDTNQAFAAALLNHFLPEGKLMLGFFGDHWQKIYEDGCGKLSHGNLREINKHANFRSRKEIVAALNRMRPELTQEVSDPTAVGTVAVFHSNQWQGTRRGGAHWKGDLPEKDARRMLGQVKTRLVAEGWDFSPQATKILMLTHGVLAREQGYAGIAACFGGRSGSFAKKEDPHVAFLVDVVEPVCRCFEEKRFGEMFSILGGKRPAIMSLAEKSEWSRDLQQMLRFREAGTIGNVLYHLRKTGRFPVPEQVEAVEHEIELSTKLEDGALPELSRRAQAIKQLREVQYKQVSALSDYINGFTPFSTNHGVKGEEYQNVLVVLGRGWSDYNFVRFLEMSRGAVSETDREFFERNRNLFYVACSRPKQRLALLFTQEISPNAMRTLENWFGTAAMVAL